MPPLPASETTAAALDRPIWTALTTRHAAFARGAGRARRFDPNVSPFASAQRDAPEDLDALAQLLESDADAVFLLQADPITVPHSLVVEKDGVGVQLLLHGSIEAPSIGEMIALSNDDAPEMRALAELTEPGPFNARTHEFGGFWGVKRDGRLVAMAGERLKQPGFTEVSGVCVHPDHRGRGYARTLSALVAARIQERGETPYLHAYRDNSSAIALYESLGFRRRAEVNVAVLRRRSD